MEFQLSNQAVGSIMMLLQKAILNTISDSTDVDVVEILKNFKLHRICFTRCARPTLCSIVSRRGV